MKTQGEDGHIQAKETGLRRKPRGCTHPSQTFQPPCGSAGKESACNAGRPGFDAWVGRSPGEAKGYPIQYSDLENSMDCIVHGVAKRQTRPSDFHLILFFFFFDGSLNKPIG